MLFELQNDLKVCILEGSSNAFSIGHKIITYDLQNRNATFKKDPVIFNFSNYYKHFYNIFEEINMFVGAPYLTKQLRYFTISDTKNVTCFDIKSNGHKIRQVKLFYCKKWLLSCGLDGLIVVRKANPKRNKNNYAVIHHRHDVSVAKATINSTGNLIITLGIDGILIAIKYFQSESALSVDKKLNKFYEICDKHFESPESKVVDFMDTFDIKEIEFLSEPLPTYMNPNESMISWSEWKRQQIINQEAKQYFADKEQVISKLKILKSKIQDLLNKNEASSELKKLPMPVFALNKINREKKIKSAKDKREEVNHELKSDCLQMERIINWIKTKFWDPQKVLGQSIFSLFGQTEVSNYTIATEVLTPSKCFEHSLFVQSVLKEMMNDETIYPWEIRKPSEIKLIFNNQLRMKVTDEIGKIDHLFDNDEEPEVKEEFNFSSLEGK
jgi:hypothetical protein